MKILLTDVDDVLLTFHSSFSKYLETYKGFKKIKSDCYKFSEMYDFDPTLEINYINEFAKSYHFANLQPFGEAEKYLKKIKDNNWYIVAITAVDNDDDLLIKRKINLKCVLGNVIDEIHMIGTRKSKLNKLKEFKKTIFIDDNTKHIEEGIEANHDVLLMSRPYNTFYYNEKVKRVNNWKEIYEYLQSYKY